MLQTNSLEKPTYLTWRVVCATLTACLGSISFGYVLGYPSPVQDHLMDRMNWSDEQMTWFSSIASLGAMFGALVGLYTIERFGRKFTIMLSSLPFVGGWLLIAGAKVTSLFYVGRFLTGAGMGVVSFTVPLYIVEISPAKYRGTLASANQLGVTIGILFAYCFGAVLNWHWLAITGAVPGAAMAILITGFPETPRWLIKNDKIREACHVLVYLRGTSYEECELESKEIQSTLEIGEPTSLREFFKPMIYRPFIVGLMLMMFQQFSGINAVTSYASQILDDAGMSNANVEEIAITVVQTFGTAVSCVIIDRLGRRLLLIFPGALMGVSMIVLGASRYFDGFPSYITLISLCVYIIGFSMGLGPIPWVVTAEILPTKVRGFASSFATQVNWLSAFIVIKTYVSMVHAMHSYGCYWFYAAVCLISVVYVFFFLPETKGKTLEEVEKLFIDKQQLLNGKTGKKYGAVHA